jgi:hypothetical protein
MRMHQDDGGGLPPQPVGLTLGETTVAPNSGG